MFKEIRLKGYALVWAKLVRKNEKNEIIFQTKKIISTGIECPAKKQEIYDQIEHYTIDNSIIDYDENDIIPIENFDFVVVNEFELYHINNLRFYKNIDKFLEDKMNNDLEIEEILEIISFDLSED